MTQPPEWVLITGAASGIGREFAVVAAKRHWKLVLVDIDKEKLAQTAEEIARQYAVTIRTFDVDLSLEDAPEKCLQFCDDNGIEIDFLINNAGIFFFDPLLDANPRKVETMCRLHIYGVTRMCIVFGRRMRERRFGYILNMSSLSAWMAMPGINVYNATKAYIRSLSKSLYFELKPYHVGVTAICPGGINTALFGLPENLRKLACRLGFLMSPQKLAEKAVKSALKKRAQSIPGVLNHVLRFFMLLLPDGLVLPIAKKVPIYKRFFPSSEERDGKAKGGKKSEE